MQWVMASITNTRISNSTVNVTVNVEVGGSANFENSEQGGQHNGQQGEGKIL